MNKAERQSLINAIALRQGTARELANHYGMPVSELRQFAMDNHLAIKAAHQRLTAPEDPKQAAATLTPTQLEDLWITNKFERLKRLQTVAETTERMINDGGMSPAEAAMAVREFRSYLMLAANELGQLLHRGAGDSGTGDTLSFDIAGVDMDNLR